MIRFLIDKIKNIFSSNERDENSKNNHIVTEYDTQTYNTNNQKSQETKPKDFDSEHFTKLKQANTLQNYKDEYNSLYYELGSLISQKKLLEKSFDKFNKNYYQTVGELEEVLLRLKKDLSTEDNENYNIFIAKYKNTQKIKDINISQYKLDESIENPNILKQKLINLKNEINTIKKSIAYLKQTDDIKLSTKITDYEKFYAEKKQDIIDDIIDFLEKDDISTISNISKIPYDINEKFEIMILSNNFKLLNILIKNEIYKIRHPKNSTWENIILNPKDICLVEKIPQGNNQKLNLLKVKNSALNNFDNSFESTKKLKTSMYTSSSKPIVSTDKELDKLKLELKYLESKLQELIEEKTEYLNDIEEFNTLYNLYLGELIKSILNLKKEILYKQTIKQQENRKKYKEDIKVFNSTKENIEEIKQTIEEFEKILEDIDKDDENYDEIFATYKELKEELEKLENELEKQEENLSKTKEKIDNNEVFEEYEESKKQYEQFHQNYEDIKQQQSDVFDITNEQKNELKKLWKKACKLCHPDIVIDKFKEKAHEIMQALNDAYSKKDIVKVQKILSNLENGLSFEIESDNINDKEILKSKINQYKKNILDLESEIEDLKQDDTYQTIQEIDDMNEYFEELKFELQSEKERLENEAKDILDNTEKKNIKESIKKSTPKKKTKSKIEPEKSQYSKYIQSIENSNFEKIRRYCNNLLNDNKADEMQKYLAENGKMQKALIYDALEQFISKLDKTTITLVDWGCGQGIGSMLVLDYIKEKQLDIVVNQIILLDDNITAISRAMSQIEPLKQNDIEIITVRSDDISELEKLKDIKNNIILNLIVNDKFPVDYKLFKNSYFMCVSNSNKNFVDEIYENISDFGSVENLSIRDSKIGRFDKYERIFKI